MTDAIGGAHLRIGSLHDLEVVPSSVADEIIAEVRAAIDALEAELAELRHDDQLDGTPDADEPDAARLDAATELLLEQAGALVADAEAYREQRLADARAEADAILAGQRSFDASTPSASSRSSTSSS